MTTGERILKKMGYDKESVWLDVKKFQEEALDLKYNNVLDDLELWDNVKIPYINMYANMPSSKQQVIISAVHGIGKRFTAEELSNIVVSKRNDVSQYVHEKASVYVELDALRSIGAAWNVDNMDYNDRSSPNYNKHLFEADRLKIQSYFPGIDDFKDSYGVVCKRRKHVKNSRNEVMKCAMKVLNENLGLEKGDDVLGVVSESDIRAITYFDLKRNGVKASKKNMSGLRKNLIKKMKKYKASQTVNMPIMSSGTLNTPK